MPPYLGNARIGKRSIGTLLYADDAVLLARTPIGLQRIVTNFASYMSNLDLKVNISKTFIMKYSKPSIKCCEIFINSEKLNLTDHFSYLGIVFDKRGFGLKLLIVENCFLLKSSVL